MALTILAIFLAVLFALIGAAKVAAVPPMRESAGRLGFSVSVYRLIGVLELAGAAGALLGLVRGVIGVLAAAGLLALLAGAVVALRRAGEGRTHLALPTGTAVAVAVYLVLVVS
ncbi:DoxX family protein [Frankia sp. CNm7]|uniref:DoxX family protein n=1 Tax=Frankia nepalensis TaxID=1836974 RepID=A0A937RMY3_9ACTN|nr:DoxX family protein [Frankia nepalensis]MBL7501964.1 DoxX family protein [Frankia nepalensis]MBL7510594.1 DoxX family protein [Frankia nepalensis]MBL7517334.1 DoxX family protein [Frankia nepalensis]MBL7633417.1 DoxX family protein [Frankia nepalensis]